MRLIGFKVGIKVFRALSCHASLLTLRKLHSHGLNDFKSDLILNGKEVFYISIVFF